MQRNFGQHLLAARLAVEADGGKPFMTTLGRRFSEPARQTCELTVTIVNLGHKQRGPASCRATPAVNRAVALLYITTWIFLHTGAGSLQSDCRSCHRTQAVENTH
jgi:hypothetical protein